MPRDLFSTKSDVENPSTTIRNSYPQSTTLLQRQIIQDLLRRDEKPSFGFSHGQDSKSMDDLHPRIETLNETYLDSCVALEAATFPEQERCSREKFLYRLAICPELSLGFFSTVESGASIDSLPTFPFARAPSSFSPQTKAVLIAHISATKSLSPTITEESMQYPYDWQSGSTLTGKSGHQEPGRTIALHSLAVLPRFQRRGVGKTLLLAFIQRMEASGVADRISLIAHEPLISYYEGLGFENRGVSQCKYGLLGAAKWFDLTYDFAGSRASS